MALGIAAVALPIIAIAQLRGRRWPLYPGDAMMLGAFGFLLGPRRSGMDDAARIGVLARLSGLGSATARPAHPQRPRAARPGHDRRGGRGVPVRQFRRCLRCRRTAASWRAGRHRSGGYGNGFPFARYSRPERSPASGDGTGSGQHRAARGNCHSGSWCSSRRDAVSFPVAVRRLSSLSGISITIEERPARIAGGMAILSDAPPIRLVWRGALAGLLDRLAALSGYDWTLAGGNGRLLPLLGYRTTRRGCWLCRSG